MLNNSRHFSLAFDRGRIWVRSSSKMHCSNRSFVSCENSGQKESALEFACEPSKRNPLRVSSRRANRWAALGLPSMGLTLVTRMDRRYVCSDGSEKRPIYDAET